MSKFWLCFLAGPNSVDDLKELIEPVKPYFNGVVATCHARPDSEEAIYLESVKGEGKIVYTDWCKRHDFARNHYLFCGPIRNGDWVCQIDVLERLNESFASSIFGFCAELEKLSLNMVYYYSKPFIFQYHESMTYVGSPHESLQRENGFSAVELANAMPNEDSVRKNVRPIKRTDPYHFVLHYLNYYLYPWGSNQCLLGLDNNPNRTKIFYEREYQRMQLCYYLESIGVDRTAKSVVAYMKNKDALPEPFIKFINTIKPLNDAYRLYVLERKDFKDDHDWANVVSVQ